VITATIEFEQPTPAIPPMTARPAVAYELVENPGQWALIGTWPNAASARQMAYAIRQGSSGWQMFGRGFEAQAVTVIGEHRIYVRYVGGA
jgi:hypothetical protein